MAQSQPSFSCRYNLTLDEAKDGFALATFGKRRFSQYLTPILSVLIIIWGFYIGVAGVGKLYVILGAVFLGLQILLRLVFLPKLFARQFKRYQFAQAEQGIDLYQQHAVLYVSGSSKNIAYGDIEKFAEGKLAYMLRLKSKTVLIISKAAIQKTGKQDFFESILKAYR